MFSAEPKTGPLVWALSHVFLVWVGLEAWALVGYMVHTMGI